MFKGDATGQGELEGDGHEHADRDWPAGFPFGDAPPRGNQDVTFEALLQMACVIDAMRRHLSYAASNAPDA